MNAINIVLNGVFVFGAGIGVAGENAPKGAGKKKNTKARMDKAEEEAINAAKAAAFMKDEEEA